MIGVPANARYPLRRNARLCALPLLALAGLLCCGSALGARVENTALVSYGGEPGESIPSNTVVFDVLPLPAPAQIEFHRYDPESDESSSIPIDGGQCMIPGGGFIPLPGVSASDGTPLDSQVKQRGGTVGYYVGEPVLITLADANRNANPAAREMIEVDLTTTTGDAETLRLLETGVDTGLFAGAIQSVLMPPSAVQYDCQLSLVDGAVITARYSDSEFPLDAVAVAAVSYAPLPPDRTVLRLEQKVSRQFAEVGDFLQYTLVLRNIHEAPASGTRIDDTLPRGVRYRAGSLRVGAARAEGETGGTLLSPAPDPGFAPDGGFRIPTGDLASGESVTATFVAEVGPAARGPELVNRAQGSARGALKSNETDTVVRVRASLQTSTITIVGRVLAAEACGAPAAERRGVPHVRVLLDDGTYTSTDANGAYHFEGIRPGTHVAQLDLATLSGLEPDACHGNTRHAGRGYSQFVEAQGGMLVRADFLVRPKASPVSEAGLRLRLTGRDGRLDHALLLDGDEAMSRVTATVILAGGSEYVPGSAKLDGTPVRDPEIRGGFATFRLGGTRGKWEETLSFQTAAPDCAAPGGPPSVHAFALFETVAGTSGRTPDVEARPDCTGRGPPRTAGDHRAVVSIAAAGKTAASPLKEDGVKPEILDDIAAAGGGDRDWLEGQPPGRALLFPGEGYNPRMPVTRVVVKRMKTDRVALAINGEPVSGLAYDHTETSDSGIEASIWRSVHLRDGDNLLEATITDADGNVVARLSRKLHFAVDVARAEFLPERSRLVADGLHRPVIAVRMLDRFGQPARHGLGGVYSITAPYKPAVSVGEEQDRRFAGMERDAPTWRVEGDEGIAWIELQPTTIAGSFTIGFDLGATDASKVHQEVEGWLKAEARDWVVVGFARGSVGYDTLADNMQALPEGEEGSGLRADGQVSLYAKGRVRGDWLLTLAYDSDKPTGELRDRGLLSTIDPRQYYTLYGDGTRQGYDAPSVEKLYLKLERDQFYALFGDFQTGLDDNELARYQRTLSGVKVEYHGPLVQFNGFAAETSQSYAHDEIQGDGTSGLYRLRHGGILMNSERVRIETRDRYHSEQILERRELVRHIDYDIDYQNGTLFFREPIASRDFDFNPNFIVVDYETRGGADTYLNAGGRASVRLMDGRLEAGASYLRDEDMQGRSELAGVDAKFQLTPADEIRAEAATTRGKAGSDSTSGSAWLLEWRHHGQRSTLFAYARRYGLGFGLGQQGTGQAGTFKVGAEGQWRVNEQFSLQGEVYRVENLASGAVRDAAKVDLAYRAGEWSARAGLQWVRDQGRDGRVEESRQATFAASRFLLDHRLELGLQADLSLGGSNDSVDFPTRLQARAAYAITPDFRVIAAQEVTDGENRDTATTRFGFEAAPWKNARLTSTLNQSRISEYGPRTFALFGLNQRFRLGERWSLDVAVDSSHAFNESGEAPLVGDPSQPIAPGGMRDGGALTEDFVAVSAGATYQTALWGWNIRVEGREGETDRYGFTTAFLRQVRDGIALSASMQAFSQHGADGSTGLLANAQVSWAYRPLGSRWSMLDKLEFRLDGVARGRGEAIVGQDSLATIGDARSRRMVNNFVMNYASAAWEDEDTGGVLSLDQRSQLALYYGSKYVLDTYDGEDYSGYSDILGAEWRFDLTPRVDIGLRASVLHSWSQDTFAWAFGPSIGFTPFTNAWVSLGYNIRGFNDRDFEDAHHTAQGPYLKFRMKFDQQSLGLGGGGL